LELLRLTFSPDDYKVLSASCREACTRAAEHAPSLVILDLCHSQKVGLERCRAIRASYNGPILVLGPDGDDGIRATAFESGADQYLPKPFSAVELRARVQAMLRRIRGAALPAVLRAGDLEIDLVQRRASRAGVELGLTAIEFDLLTHLAENSNGVVS